MHQTRYTIRLICLIGILGTLLFSSCGTRAPRYDYRELAQAAIRLDMDIAMEDNHRLYIESSRWIGVPYRTGGNTMRGVDCSGLTYNIYKKVYHKHLKRNSDDQPPKQTSGKPTRQANAVVTTRQRRMAGNVTHPSVHARFGPRRVSRSSFHRTQSK